MFSEVEEELRLTLNWKPANMFDFAHSDSPTDDLAESEDSESGLTIPPVELLMFALPHHQERIRPTPGSSNVVKHVGCHANLHGVACPVSLLPQGSTSIVNQCVLFFFISIFIFTYYCLSHFNFTKIYLWGYHIGVRFILVNG